MPCRLLHLLEKILGNKNLARALSNKAKPLDLITRGRLLVDISGWNLVGCLQLLGGRFPSCVSNCFDFAHICNSTTL